MECVPARSSGWHVRVSGRGPDKFSNGRFALGLRRPVLARFAVTFRTVPIDGFDAASLSLSFLRCVDVSTARASRARRRDALQRRLQVCWLPTRVHRTDLLAGTAAPAAKRSDGRQSKWEHVSCMTFHREDGLRHLSAAAHVQRWAARHTGAGRNPQRLNWLEGRKQWRCMDVQPRDGRIE